MKHKLFSGRNNSYVILFVFLLIFVSVGAGAAVLEEVVVTAQKREQNLQDVGISITAFSGEQMKALGVTSTVEITEQVPGLQYTAWSPVLTTFNVRGVSQNNFTDNMEAPVAVYIDDAYVASMNSISGQLFDVDRVEVLRGPQGTLFGRNATGGVIHYVTRGADDEEFNGYVEGGYSEHNKYSAEFAAGGALSDRLRVRVAARREKSDGYIKAANFDLGVGFDAAGLQAQGLLPPSSGNDIGGSDGYSVRAELQFDITEKATLELQYKYSEDNKVATGGYSFLPYGDNTQAYIPPEFENFVTGVIGAPAAATPDIFFCNDQIACFTPVDQAGRTIFEGDHPQPYKHYSDYAGFMDRDTNNVTAKLDWELDNGMQLVSITNYQDLNKFYTEDGDGIPAPIIEFTTVADFYQWSQETRLSGEAERTRWQIGGYYLDMKTNGDVTTRGAPVAGVVADLGFTGLTVNPGVTQDYTLDSSNWSIFGQLEYDLNDAFTLIAGLRWSQDDKDLRFVKNFEDAAAGLFVPNLFDLQTAIAVAGGGNQDNVDYGDYAIRAQLDWHFNDETLVFASFNRGIKGGNFAPAANATITGIKHNEEVLKSYEVGFKTEFADGIARLNATAFYYDYDDYQAFTFVGGNPSIKNANARNYGAELELFVSPNTHWDMVMGASFMDSKVNGVQTPQFQTTPVGFVVDWPIDVLNGVELPNTPSFGFNYLLRYNWNALGGNIAVQMDGVYYDDQYLEVTNGGGALQKAYGVVNANISWTSEDEHWHVKADVKNLTDEVYKLYNLDLGILGSTAFYAPPRWFGGSASYSW